jgi:hypothetical protein
MIDDTQGPDASERQLKQPDEGILRAAGLG